MKIHIYFFRGSACRLVFTRDSTCRSESAVEFDEKTLRSRESSHAANHRSDQTFSNLRFLLQHPSIIDLTVVSCIPNEHNLTFQETNMATASIGMYPYSLTKYLFFHHNCTKTMLNDNMTRIIYQSLIN